LWPDGVGCVRSKILRPTGLLDIKANKKEGVSEGQISKRLISPTEIEVGLGVFRLTAKKLGTFS